MLPIELDGIDTTTLSEEGVEMTVLRTDNAQPVLQVNKTALKLRLRGPDSEGFQQTQRQQIRHRLERRQGAVFIPGSDDDIAASNEETLDHLVHNTIGWNVVDTASKPLLLTPELVREFYKKYPAIRDQAEAFYQNRRNFTKASPKG